MVGAVGSPTNSLIVFYPEKVSAGSALQELAPHGDIAHLEVSPDIPDAVVVSYYDIRSAGAAAAALGSRCDWAPQFGNRTVSVDGQTCLDEWMLKEVALVRQRENDTDKYALEFFDTRSATQAQMKLQVKQEQEVGLDDPLHLVTAAEDEPQTLPEQLMDFPATPPVAAPRYRNDLRLSEVSWADLADGRDTRTTLRLRCLPSFLCKEESLHRILASAGLDKVVDCIHVFPSRRGQRGPGSALVNAVDGEGAATVAKYFHGRRWGMSMPVAVSFAAVQGRREVEEKFLKDPFQKEITAVPGVKDPWRIEACSAAQPVDDLYASEVSTEVGDDGETAGASSIDKEVPAKIVDFSPVHLAVHA